MGDGRVRRVVARRLGAHRRFRQLHSEQGQGGVVTLRQRGMPFDGDWLADNALGDLNAPDIGLARLATALLFCRPARCRASPRTGAVPPTCRSSRAAGVPGLYDGIVVPDFRTLDGSTATAGAQWSPASHWTVGGQFIEAHDVNLAIGTAIDEAPLLSSNTGLLTAAWAGSAASAFR